MDKKPKMAGEKTRQRLREAGLPAEFCEREGLTLDEAYEALDQVAAREQLARHGPPPASDPITGLRCHPLYSKDGTTSDVVGESHYVDWLRSLVNSVNSEHRGDSRRVYGWAVLIAEPQNRHDRNAVAVYINGGQAGYVPREIAKQIIGHLMNAQSGHKAVYCTPATLSMGSEGYVGVWLSCDLKKLPYEERRAAETPSSNASDKGGCAGLAILAFLVLAFIASVSFVNA